MLSQKRDRHDEIGGEKEQCKEKTLDAAAWTKALGHCERDGHASGPLSPANIPHEIEDYSQLIPPAFGTGS